MKKRVKVFEAGIFPQGEFSESKVKEIFGNIKSTIQGIYIHTSKWLEQGKEPLGVGEFSNFSVEGGKAFADFETNDKGTEYYNDGVFKGISVELTNGLSKIALLPLGVNPQIAGAEFQKCIEFQEQVIETPIINFEEGGNMPTLEEVKEFLKTAGIGDKIEVMSSIVGSLSEADTRAARALAWEFAEKTEVTEKDVVEFAKKKGIEVEVKEAKVAETAEQMEARIRSEYEAKDKAKSELAEFEVILSKKVLPLHQDAYRMAFMASQGKTGTVEFEEKQVTEVEMLKSKVSQMTDIDLTAEFAAAEKPAEFSEEQKAINEIDEIATQTKKLYGGKK